MKIKAIKNTKKKYKVKILVLKKLMSSVVKAKKAVTQIKNIKQNLVLSTKTVVKNNNVF